MAANGLNNKKKKVGANYKVKLIIIPNLHPFIVDILYFFSTNNIVSRLTQTEGVRYIKFHLKFKL